MRTLVVVLLLASTAAGADLSDGEKAVEVGGDALRSNWGFNWYDGSTDSLKRINVKPPRQSNTDWRWLEDGFDWLPSLGDFFTLLAWVLIATALGIIAYLLIRAYLERELAGARAADNPTIEVDPTRIDRVEELPVGVRNPHVDFLREAERHYRAGNLAEAIIYLFSHQLLELDRHNLLRLSKGKTNRQYVREVHRRAPRPQAPLAEMLRQTMLLFEEAFFGGRAPARLAFEDCWKRMSAFRSLLHTETEATTT